MLGESFSRDNHPFGNSRRKVFLKEIRKKGAKGKREEVSSKPFYLLYIKIMAVVVVVVLT